VELNAKLSDHQSAAVEFLRPHTLARLVGAAGTGKTFVAVRLPELLGLGERVVFTTPSHTARRVLEEKAQAEGIEIRTVTTTSLLWGPPRSRHCPPCLARPLAERSDGSACPCLAPGSQGCAYEDVPGADFCAPDFSRPGAGGAAACKPFWRDWDSVIVDESSMVSRTDYDALMAGREHLRGRLIFTGDVCQLPSPEGKGWSALTEPMPEAKLTEVRAERTAAGPIIAGAAHLRRIIDPLPGEPPARGFSAEHFAAVAAANPCPKGKTGVHAFPVDQESVDAVLGLWGNAMQVWEGWEDYTVLVSTNALRVEWNEQVRRAALRGDALEEGDVLMAADLIDAPDRNGRRVGITKWSRAVVRAVEPGPANCCRAPEGRWAKKSPHRACWIVDLQVPGYGDGGTPAYITGQHVTAEALGELYPTKKAVGWIWGFARTVHTAQGDAFAHVIIHERSAIPYKDEPLEPAQRVYTAVTRAKESVTVVPTGARVPATSRKPR
jgi:hypothetical protein